MNFSVEGKRVFVTAGSDGIGKAIASAFHEAGARVHICSRTLEKLEKCAAEMPGLTYTVADAACWDDVQRVFSDIEREMGGLDFLINNAGIAGPTARVDEVVVEEWSNTVKTNLDSQFFCTKLAAPMMIKAGGGSIVNLGSTARPLRLSLQDALRRVEVGRHRVHEVRSARTRRVQNPRQRDMPRLRRGAAQSRAS